MWDVLISCILTNFLWWHSFTMDVHRFLQGFHLYSFLYLWYFVSLSSFIYARDEFRNRATQRNTPCGNFLLLLVLLYFLLVFFLLLLLSPPPPPPTITLFKINSIHSNLIFRIKLTKYAALYLPTQITIGCNFKTSIYSCLLLLW